MGLTLNPALRTATPRFTGFLEVGMETRKLSRTNSSEIGEISVVYRNATHVAERTGEVGYETPNNQRAAFGREFEVLGDMLQSILNVSHRWTDGRSISSE